MKKQGDYTERRKHKRASVESVVVGILNSGDPVAIGSINDISLGGVKCTYNELRMAPDVSPINSIDLIAGTHYLVDIPCEYAWNDRMEPDPPSELTNVRRCGIQFGKLSEKQLLLLKSFIKGCAALGLDRSGPTLHAVT
ncbi:MAG: PilZ domain-containing protein [Deltaproteobacteria bacterium]|jgi:hypothetical protein|nr:PilZ domain-containing protein [Deltaproteobacteria bacterium]